MRPGVWLQRAAAGVERRWPIVLAIVAIWIGALLVASARAKPFWHDEVYTVLLSQLSVADLWRASLDGVDLNPPLSVLAARAAHAVAGPGPVVTRVPAMAGFIAAVVFVFLILRRRTNALVAAAGAISLALMESWRYALEARAYGITMGCCAAAWYAWGEAAAGRHVTRHWIVVSAALATGVWAHYYSVLIALPIVAGELVRQGARRRIDWTPWIALVAAAVATLPLLPLAANASGQRATFWARPDTFDVAGLYDFLRGELALPIVAVVSLTVLAVAELIRRARHRDWPRRFVTHEAVAGVVAVLLPVAALLLGHVVGVFDRRYAILAVVGLAVVVPALIWMLTPANGASDVVMATVAVVLLYQLGTRVLDDVPDWRHPYAGRDVLTAWLRGGEPVVITGGVDYLAVWYYTPPDARDRAMYLADPEFQLRATGTDTSDRGYLALARWFDIPVVRLDDFLRTHDRFWLYSFGADWIERSLRQRGVRFVEHGPERDGSGRLIEAIVR